MIAGLAAKGYVAGYTDGSFMPDKELTRAEMAAMVNKILARNVKKEELPAELNKFSDLKAEEWYYADLIMASNTYKSTRGEDGIQKFVEVMK